MALSMSTEGLEDSMNKVLTTHLERQQAVLASQIQKAVAKEMDKMVLAVTRAVQENLASSLRPIQNSIEELTKKGVQVNKDDFADAVEKSVEEPLRATMADSMRNVFIPAFESVTSQVVAQISEHIPQPPPQDDSKLDALTAQMTAMSATMERMASEIDRLHSVPPPGGGGGPMSQGGGAKSPPPQMEMIRNEIDALVQQQQYESAFTKALSASTADMAVYCCRKASIGDVLGGSSPGLSQPILLCLMQQLGAVLVTAQNEPLEVTLTWLQEIALTLNTTDASIQRHVSAVLQQLVASINQKMNQGDPQLRRPLHMLLQVIRGMQLG
jgi:enhancer of mRNA-decapping protein 4